MTSDSQPREREAGHTGKAGEDGVGAHGEAQQRIGRGVSVAVDVMAVMVFLSWWVFSGDRCRSRRRNL